MKKKIDFHTPKNFIHRIQPFDVDVVFSINNTGQQTMKYLKKAADAEKYAKLQLKSFTDWETSSVHRGRTIIFAGGFVVMLKADRDEFRRFVSILVHECAHVVHYLLRDRDIPLIGDTEEIYTYHQQSLVYHALMKSYD